MVTLPTWKRPQAFGNQETLPPPGSHLYPKQTNKKTTNHLQVDSFIYVAVNDKRPYQTSYAVTTTGSVAKFARNPT